MTTTVSAQARQDLPEAPPIHLELAQTTTPPQGNALPGTAARGETKPQDPVPAPVPAPGNDAGAVRPGTTLANGAPANGVAVNGASGQPQTKYVLANPRGNYLLDFTNAVFRLDTVAAPAVFAAIDMEAPWSNQEGYGPAGPSSYSHHYGVSIGDNVSEKFFRKFAVASIAGHRDNYVPMPRGASWKDRAFNIMKHTWYVDPQVDSGGLSLNNFNWSSGPASAISAAFSNVYEPGPQRTVARTLVRVATSQGGYAVGDAWTEIMSKYPRFSRFIHYTYSVEANYSATPTQ